MATPEEMARFIAGHWTKERPTRPGVYPTRDKHGEELTPLGWASIYVHTDGTVWSALEFDGDYWSEPWPGMPG